jgi:hypothetical protein
MISAPPILKALFVQAAVSLAGKVFLDFTQGNAGGELPFFWLMLGQGVLAALITGLLRLSYWWVIFQLVAPPLMALALTLTIPLWVFPVILLLLLAVFWNVAVNRVPLYLTNMATDRRLAELLPNRPGLMMADLGSGLGGTLIALAGQRPEQHFHGFETAPVPFLLAWLLARLRRRRNVCFHYRSLWKADLSGYDVVYCFLSPVPMAALFDKAKQEMKPESLFISNSFTVPGHRPTRTITVQDTRKTRLLIWKF